MKESGPTNLASRKLPTHPPQLGNEVLVYENKETTYQFHYNLSLLLFQVHFKDNVLVLYFLLLQRHKVHNTMDVV